MIKGFIFDIDGTLLDSMHVWSDADEIFVTRHGGVYTPELSFCIRSMTFEGAADYIRTSCGFDMPLEDIVAEITDIVRRKYEEEIPPRPFVTETVNALYERHIPMCAATSNTRELCLPALARTGLLDRLEFVLTCDELGVNKDDPAVFLTAANRLGIDVPETAVVEDAPHAAATSKGAGFFTIGVDSGCFGDFELLKDCTDMRITRFDELLTLI